MNENTENTFTAYLGAEFQQRLMWQLLVEPEFAEKTIPDLSVEYFDDPNLKRLFLIMIEFIKEYEKVPNLQNQSIHQAINSFKTPNNIIEEESLFSVVKRIELWNERVLNKSLLHDGDVIQKTTNTFIRQQEYRKLGEYIIDKTKNGDIKQKYILSEIEEKILKIGHIGDDEDYGTDATEGIDIALRKEFRETIPTGVGVLDTLTGGGLGKGEIGVILTPSGVGKTTLLTKIANTARDLDKNVAQIIFEDTPDQIKRKHCVIWANNGVADKDLIGLSKIDDNVVNEYITNKVNKKVSELGNKGRLIIKKFSQENTTMKDIRNWMLKTEKKFGFKFDILVLDYLDCLDSHKKTSDRNEAELVIIKSFEALAGDFNIPAWTAVQSNRQGLDQELVEAQHQGGNIKRLQKAHFFMSVGKTPDQKEAHLANIRIIKARFAQDGQTFKDCIFNNDTMQIIIRDNRYVSYNYEDRMKLADNELKKLNAKTANLELHSKICDAIPITEGESSITVFEVDLNNIKTEFESEKSELNINIDQNINTDVLEIEPNIEKTIEFNKVELEDVIYNIDEINDKNKDVINMLFNLRKDQKVT